MDAMDATDATEAPELHVQLCSAITRRSLVMFEYGDLIRVVEPHRFGVNSAGHEMLSGWLRAGYSRSDPAGGWRNYLVHDIRALQVLEAPFAGTRPGYAAHDHRVALVYAELTPSSMEEPVDGPFVVREPMQSPAPADASNAVAPAVRSLSSDHTVTRGDVDLPDAAR